MAELQKTCGLKNEIEAQLLDSILTERDIPHVMVSYYDSAYDGLFQASRGWGHLEAPAGRAGEILAILEDLRSGAADAEESS